MNAPPAIAAPWSRYESGQSSASRTVTVEDVQQILTRDKDKPDARVAWRLSRLELKERMSSAKLESLEQSTLGPESRRALVALADASVFLAPAPADVVVQAPPDRNQQRSMIALTVDYLNKTLPRLPDFYATRTTLRYDGDPPLVRLRRRNNPQDDAPWREVGNSKVIVTYRNGKEVVDPREWGEHPSHPEGEGLITRGTFGPILSTVIVDAAHGEMTWERWERDNIGTLAVFGYRVPENQSHYSVGFHGLSNDNGNAAQGTAYHGEVAIDPATGTIRRLTVQADLPLGSPFLRGDIMVEYGPVELGGKTYMCPVRSVSISVDAMALMSGTDLFGSPTATPQAILLNDVTFADYHLFRAESRILPGTIPVPDQ